MGHLTHRARGLVVVAAFIAAFAAENASAQDAAPDVDWAYALGHELMSPFCPGRTLAECPSPNAAELRMWMVTQAAAGVTREELLAMLNERFGEDVLRAAPKAEGWGLTAYVIPIAFFVLGGPVLFMIIRRMVARGSSAAAAAPAPPAIDPALEAGLQEELERELRSG